jgi:hypothetical protein
MKKLYFTLLSVFYVFISNAQSPEIITTALSPIQITSNVDSLLAMGDTSSYVLTVQNMAAVASSGVFHVVFPPEFKVMFHTAPTGIVILPSPSLPNQYDITVNLPAGTMATANINYAVESCLPLDFGSNTDVVRNINFSSTPSPTNNILINPSLNETVHIERGQSISILNIPLATDNQSVFRYEGSTFTRVYHISSNGSNNIPFKGFIEFSDALGSALEISNLQLLMPGDTLKPLSYGLSGDTVKATIDVDSLLPAGLLVGGQDIQVLETVYVAHCLDGSGGNSMVNINWRKEKGGICLTNSGSLAPTVVRPTAPPLLFDVSFPTQADNLYTGNVCYSTSPSDNAGLYTLTKRYADTVAGNNIKNVRFNLSFSLADNGYATKRPLESVLLVRTNAKDASRNITIADFSTLLSPAPSTFNALQLLLKDFSSYTTSNIPGYFNSPASDTLNVIDYYPAGDDCSGSPFQVVLLKVDRYPDGSGGYINLNFQEGDVYDFTWQEKQCCRTDSTAANHPFTTRRARAGLDMEYPLCGKRITINNDNVPNDIYFNITEMSQNFLINTTKVLNANPDRDVTTRDGEIGEVHIENIVTGSGMYGMNVYPLLDGVDSVYLDVDVLLNDGLSLDTTGGLLPLLPPPLYNAYFHYKQGAGFTWEPSSVIDKTATLMANQRNLTSADNPNIPPGVNRAVTEYRTLRFNLNTFADLLGLSPTDPNRNVEYIMNQLSNGELFYTIKSTHCPVDDIAFMSVRSYLVNKPSCNSCRNLLTTSSFQYTLHCPGCVIPGPAITSATSLRDTSSMGPQDNNNDGVPDAVQNPANDQRNRYIVRLGDLLTTVIKADFSDGDNALGGYTYQNLITSRPDYIQDNAYLRANFIWNSGGLEIKKAVAKLNRQGTIYAYTLLDVGAGISPGADRIRMKNSSSFVDYSTAVADPQGLKTAQYNEFFFRVSVNDFISSDTNGFNYISVGNVDQITYEVSYEVVKEINAADNAVDVVYTLYTAAETDIYGGVNSTLDVGETCKTGNCIFPDSLKPYPLEKAFFWCTGGESVFGFVKYTVINSHYLEDPFLNTYNNETLNSCTKKMHIRSEVWPQNAIGQLTYSAFEYEYRTVGHPTQYQVQLPPGYTVDSMIVLSSTSIQGLGSRGNDIDEYAKILPLPVPSGSGVVTVAVPSYVTAYQASAEPIHKVTEFQQVNDMSYNELIISLSGGCNTGVPDLVYWTKDTSIVPSGSPKIELPEITLPGLPAQNFFLPDLSATQIDTTSGFSTYRAYGNYFFIKPKTGLEFTNNESTDMFINNSSFDFGVRIKNTSPKDTSNTYLTSPYNPAILLPSIDASHTYISLNKASLPSGFFIDSIYASQLPVVPLPATTYYKPISPATTEYVFDLGTTAANTQRDFRIVGHYDCSVSGCNPISASLQHCMDSALVALNYGWDCSAPVPGGSKGCGINNPLNYLFSNGAVKINVTTPASQTVNYCQTYQHSIKMESLENGSVSRYQLEVTLPDNAVYVANSIRLDGNILPDSGVTIGANHKVLFNLPALQGLSSNITNHSAYQLVFSYKYNCVDAGAETPGMSNLSTTVKGYTYCNSADTIQKITAINNLGTLPSAYDNIEINSMSCSSGLLSQGVFNSHIKIQNTASIPTRNVNKLRVTLPSGVTFNATGTTSGYTLLSATLLEWTLPVITASAILPDYVVNYSVASLTSCPQNFVLSAALIGQPDILCSSTNGTCNIPKTLSTASCTSTVTAAITANAGPDKTICAGTSVQIGSAAVAGVTYRWSPTTGLSNSTVANPFASPSTTTVYTVTATSLGCTGQDVVVVTVNPKPTVNAGPDASICGGGSVVIGTTGLTGVSYHWSPAMGLSNVTTAKPTAAPAVTTTYVLIASIGGVCSATDTVVVKVNSRAVPKITTNAAASLCTNNPIQFINTSTNVLPTATFNWNFGVGATPSSSIDSLAPPVVYSSAGTKNIKLIINSGGCVDSFKFAITIGTCGNSCNRTLNYTIGTPGVTTTISPPTPGIIGNFNGSYKVSGHLIFKNGVFVLNAGTVFYMNSTSAGIADIQLINATLILHGATITAFCDQMWGGISTDGNSSIITDAAGSGSTIDSSEVSHSLKAINFTFSSASTAKLQVQQTRLVNNLVHISGQVSCNGTNDRTDYTPCPPPAGIANSYIKNNRFYSNPDKMKFPYQPQSLNKRYYSIYGITLGSYNYLPLTVNGNTFTNLIHAFYSGKYVSLTNNTFLNCYGSSIDVSYFKLSTLIAGSVNPPQTLISGNSITVPSSKQYTVQISPTATVYGIYATENFNIHNNTIQSDNPNPFALANTKDQVGIYTEIVNGTSSIANNTIQKLKRGIDYSINSGNAQTVTGNTFVNNLYAVNVPSNPFSAASSAAITCNAYISTAAIGSFAIPRGINLTVSATLTNAFGTSCSAPAGNKYTWGHGGSSFGLYNTSPNRPTYYQASNDNLNAVISVFGFWTINNTCGSYTCGGAVGAGHRLADAAPIDQVEDSLRSKVGTAADLQDYQQRLISYYIQNNNITELESYTTTIADSNLDAYNTLSLYLMQYYQNAGDSVKAQSYRDAVLAKNPGNDEIYFRVKYIDVGNNMVTRLDSMSITTTVDSLSSDTSYVPVFRIKTLSTQDSTALSEIANSATSKWERACIRLRHYYPHAQCSDISLYDTLSLYNTERKGDFKIMDTTESAYLGYPEPNPANNETLISYTLTKETKEAKILIYDMVKGIVMRTYSLSLEKINSRVLVNLTGFSSGIYAYSLIIDGKQIDTKKMAVVK